MSQKQQSNKKSLNPSTPKIPPSKQVKQIGDFIIGKSLGQGNFGKVRIGIHKYTGEKVAIKILQKDKIKDMGDIQRVNRQIHILKLLRHPNIVQLYQIIETKSQILLIMQFMENGELFDFIVKRKRISDSQARKMFHQLIDGIEYVHKIGIAHRDLKPENILLGYDRNRLKIVDFGLSNIYKKDELLKTACGSPCYAAPEMVLGQKYEGKKIDIWSSGIILFAMLNGYLPFEDDNTSVLYQKVLAGDYSFHSSISQEGRDLITKILNNNPSERYTIDQIRNHPWMMKYQGKKHQEGIIVGYNNIPVDQEILKLVKVYCPQKDFDLDYVQKCIEANRHNQATVAYYLTMKKFLKQGGVSKCDLANSRFDKKAIQPIIRKKQNTTQILIDNFLTKSSEANVDHVSSHQNRKSRLSKERRNIEENKENMEILMNKKKSKEKMQRKSKEKSRDNIKIVLKERDHNVSTQIMPGSTTHGLKKSSKLNESVVQKRSQSVGKKKNASTGKIKSSKGSRLDSSINYGRVPMTRSIQKTSGRESQSHQPRNYFNQQAANTKQHRQSMIDNRITRKYKEQFGQSLVSRSKGKNPISSQRQRRSRIHSSSIVNQSVNYGNFQTGQNVKITHYEGFNTTSVMTNNTYTMTGNHKENVGVANTSVVLNNPSHHITKKLNNNKQVDISTGFIEEYLMRNKKAGTKKTVFSSKSNSTHTNDMTKTTKPTKQTTDSSTKFTKNPNSNITHNQSTGKMVVKARRL